MKLATVKHKKITKYGFITENRIYFATDKTFKSFPTLRDLICHLEKDITLNKGLFLSDGIELSQVDFCTPIREKVKIICVGLNYEKIYPVEGVSPPKPENIILFGKEHSSLVAHNEGLEFPIGKPGLTFDYEGEVAVIIGKSGRNISISEAENYIFGYSILNDGSVREWQKHSIYAGKNFQNSSSWGPYVVTKDEFNDVEPVQLSTYLNSERVQDTTIDKMIFSIAEQISYISTLYTLHPGDVIATGSPDGTGGSQNPKRHLISGDKLEVTVSGIGSLVNYVT